MTHPRWYLGIGAQKAGTSWLSHNLRQHPGIWRLPVKEFHFFDEPVAPMQFRALRPTLANPRWKKLVAREMPLTLVDPRRWPNARWLLRFATASRTDETYRALMAGPAARIGGDVTPAYARLDDCEVARIRRVLPEARVIYLLRDPLSRAWSQASMHFRKRGSPDIESVPRDVLLRFFTQDSVRRNGDYLRTLDIWERHFCQEQIHVDFLERVAQDPQGVLEDVLKFIGVTGRARVSRVDLAQPRNSGHAPPLPPDMARVLADQFHDTVTSCHRRFNNAFTAAWVDRCERALHA